MNYLNEFDPHAAAWLRELRDAGLVPPCDIDTRSIEDVTPNDLRGYKQCHFFAGIGGWPLALQLAGVSADEPLWTGSCPCQPFSTAGKGAGFADERHLWPAFFHLIRECRPAAVFGEQVASRDGLDWLDLVCADLEGASYAVGAADLCAAGVGAPHIRQRLFWVANATGVRRVEGRESHATQERDGAAGNCADSRMGDAYGFGAGRDGRTISSQVERENRQHVPEHALASGADGGLAHANGRIAGSERQQRSGQQRQHPQDGGRLQDGSAGALHGHWAAADWIRCRDGRWRPVEPGTFPLADGLPARVGRLRGYGNAINPYQAAAFVRSAMLAAKPEAKG